MRENKFNKPTTIDLIFILEVKRKNLKKVFLIDQIHLVFSLRLSSTWLISTISD